jgi:GTPase involved in cell partitioning and DNA repair
MGKGMDGHAGKDLIVKVPCGTLVWKLDSGNPAPLPEETKEPEEESAEERPSFKIAGAARAVLRHAGGERALEIDLSKDESESDVHDADKGELLRT